MMKILINDHLEIGTIQKKFNEDFPYLRLGFFMPGAEMDKIFSRSNLVEDKTMKIGQLRSHHYAGYWNIRSGQKVGDFEKEFTKVFGLYIQVFRRSGSSWLETGNSDDLTLEEQNNIGRESIMATGKDQLPDMDHYHEQI